MIVRERQLAIRREMERRDISLKAVAFDAKMEYPTVVSYFPGGKEREPSTLNVAGLYKLIEGDALPLELLSMLLPAGYQLVRSSEEIDHDEFEAMTREYLAAKGKAHREDSEAGREIGPGERAALDAKVVQLRAA
jgi:hypothetical protein